MYHLFFLLGSPPYAIVLYECLTVYFYKGTADGARIQKTVWCPAEVQEDGLDNLLLCWHRMLYV